MTMGHTILLFVFILCVLTVYGLYVYFPIKTALKIDQKLVPDAVAYEQHPANPTMQVLFMGDSTAVGVGSVQKSESTAGRLGAEYPNSDISNRSKSGMVLRELLPLIEAQSGMHYDLVVLQIGANDVVGFTTLGAVREQLRKILKTASGIAPHVAVLTAGDIGQSPVFRWPLSSLMSARTRSVRAIFMEEIATTPNAFYIDIYNSNAGEIFNSDLNRYYAPDYFHPSGDGYGVWYALLLRALKEQSIVPAH